MAGIQGTNIVAPVVPLDTADVHPTHEAQYGKGGFRSVETTAARDAIPAPRREAGMLVYVAGTGTTWRLGSDLATWTEDGGGGGGGGATGPTGPASTVTGPTGATGPAGTTTWSGITGTPATFPPAAHTHAIADTTGLQAALDLKSTIESPQFTNLLDAARFTDDANTVTSISGGFVTTRRVTFATDGTGVWQTTAFTGTLKTKLDGIATGATANATDAQLRDRSTHTGTQAAGTITGLAASATTDATNAANITSGTLARARIPGDLGTGSMTVSGSNSYGVSLDATARTLTQANTLAIMGGSVGIGTLAPLAAVGLEVAAPNATGSREILRVRNTTAGSTGYFDIGIGTAGYFQDQVIFIANGTIAMRILTSPAGQVIFPSSLRMPNGQQIIGDSNANAYIEMNNGAGQLSMSCVSAMSFQRLYVEVGRWDTNSVWNVGTGHASAASSGGSSVTGTQARVRFPGQVSTAAGQFAAAGDAQASRYHLRRTTTDATATTLFRDGAATRITIPAQSCWSFKIRLSAYNSTDGSGAAWTINGGIRRDNANGTALLGAPVVTQFADTAMASTTVAVTADDTNEALQVNVTGLAGKTIRWHAVVETSEVSAGTPS